MEPLKDVFNKEILILNKEMEIVYSTLDDIHSIQYVIQSLENITGIQNNNLVSKICDDYKITIQENMIEQNLYYIIKIESLHHNKCVKSKNCFRRQETLKKCIEVIREVLNNMTLGPYGIELTNEILIVSQLLDELIALYMQGQTQAELLEEATHR